MLLLAAMLSTATVWAEVMSIGTVAEWNTFADRVNVGETTLNGLLTADLNFSGETFTVVGTSAHPFCGIFDGAGHTVKGISVSKSGGVTADRQGLFGTIGSGGVVRNVTVSNSSFAGWDYVGGIAGYNQGGTVSYCHVTGTVTIGATSGKDHHGGIVGYNSNFYSTVSHCTSAATVTNSGQTGCHDFGGIVGSNSGGTVEHCLAVGATVSAVTYSGAIVGSNTSTLSYNYYGHCTVGEATSNIGTRNGDVDANEGAVPAIILYDRGTEASGNGTTISASTGSDKNVALYGRTLYKDGAWNTICLPFTLTISGSALDGATARPLTDASISSTTLNLTFGSAVSTLEAGTPYIIKWTRANDYVDDDSHNIVSPVFSGVTVSTASNNYDNSAEGDLRVRFLGTYKSTTFDANDNSILLMGGSNTLYYPMSGAGIGACRAYFKLGNDGALLAHHMTDFNIEFDDDATSIESLFPDTSPSREGSTSAWYTLSGTRLSAQPTQPGLYLNNRRMVVIK